MKNRIKVLTGLTVLLLVACIFAIKPDKAYAYAPVDTSKLDMEAQYWAGLTGFQYKSSLYFAYDGNIVRYTNKMAAKGAEPAIFLENVNKEPYSKMFGRKNILIYVSNDNAMHLYDLKKKTDRVIQTGVGQVMYFDGKVIGYSSKSSRGAWKYCSKTGKKRSAPENWTVDDSPYITGDGILTIGGEKYRLVLKKKKNSLFYRIDGDQEVLVAEPKLKDLFYDDEYNIRTEGDYIVIGEYGDSWDVFSYYDKNFRLVFTGSRDETFSSRYTIKGDYMYVYEEVDADYFEDEVSDTDGYTACPYIDDCGDEAVAMVRYRIVNLREISESK